MKILFFVIISSITVLIIGCSKDTTNTISKKGSGVEFFLTKSDILSKDSNYVLGSLSYDSQSEEYSIEIDTSGVIDYLNSVYFELEPINIDIKIIDNYIYLYYSFSTTSPLLRYAEDIIIDGTISSIDSGGGETHSCDGSCGGANNLITICSSCEFVRTGGKITGCNCVHSPGYCCHTVTSS